MKTAIRSTLVAACVLLAATTSTYAHCIVGDAGSKRPQVKGLIPSKVEFAAAAAAAAGGPASGDVSVVGLWTVTFLAGDGPAVWDVGFEQFHADGTEFTIDTAVPPAAGNVCVGVWDRVGDRGVKLHHVGWNWDASVSPAALAGAFVLDLDVELAPGGRTFSGHYVTDSYDLDGNVIPELHADGVVTGSRITVNSPRW